MQSKRESEAKKRERERFHGAFTGGFSAGYYNTVGSAEGWTPTQYASSRNSRAKHKMHRPEDYMDEEDLNDAHIVGETLTARANFSNTGTTNEKFADIIVSQKESIGVQLLKQMGWNSHVNNKQKRKQNVVYGPQPSPPTQQQQQQHDDDDDDDWNIEDEGLKFDIKRNVFGLGYEANAHEKQASRHVDKGGGKISMDGRNSTNMNAFGLSALEEVDVYERNVYDDDNDDDHRMYDIKQSISKNDEQPLEFVAAVRSNVYILSKDDFPTINVPKEFVTKHRFKQANNIISSQIRQRLPGYQAYVNTRKLNANDRSRILGETSLSSSVKKLTHVDKKQLTASLESNFQVGERMFAGTSSDTGVRHEDAREELQLQYPLDAEKQERFEHFLHSKSTKKPYINNNTMQTEWQKKREHKEFDGVYDRIQDMLYKNINNKDEKKVADRTKHATTIENINAAAKMKMFGDLTRVVHDFVPEKLLCKRFEVNNPWKHRTPNHSSSSSSSVLKSDERFHQMMQDAVVTSTITTTPTIENKKTRHTESKLKASRVEAKELLKSILKQDNDDETTIIESSSKPTAPPSSLFKAIFANDDSTDDDDDDDDVKINRTVLVPPKRTSRWDIKPPSSSSPPPQEPKKELPQEEKTGKTNEEKLRDILLAKLRSELEYQKSKKKKKKKTTKKKKKHKH